MGQASKKEGAKRRHVGRESTSVSSPVADREGERRDLLAP